MSDNVIQVALIMLAALIIFFAGDYFTNNECISQKDKVNKIETDFKNVEYRNTCVLHYRKS